MYDYDMGSSYYPTNAGLEGLEEMLGAFAAIAIVASIISLAVTILLIISQWKIFTKAGKPGWASIIPIYNFIVLLEIVNLPIWNIILFLIPIANIYIIFKIYIELAHKFGKSTGFGVLMTFFSFIFLPILAFGKNNIYNGKNNQTVVDTIENITPQEFFHQEQNAVENKSINSENEPMFNQNVNTEINPISNPEETNISSEPEQLNNIETNSNINDSNNMVNTIIEPQTILTTNINTQPIVANEIEESNVIENNETELWNNNSNLNNQGGIITNFDAPNNMVNEQQTISQIKMNEPINYVQEPIIEPQVQNINPQPVIPNEIQSNNIETPINQSVQPNAFINGNQPIPGLNNQPQINIPTINYPQPESNQNNNQNM